MVGEVVARVDVEVFGRHDVLVTGLPSQIVVDRRDQLGAARHGQRATLAEVLLHVDDDQRPHAIHPSF